MSSLQIAIGRAQYRAYTGLFRRALGLRKSTLEVGGHKVPLLTRDGDGDPIVFVHGFGADKEGWLGIISRLRGRRIIALDLPGFGAASRIGRDQSKAALQARVIRDVLDSLGVSRATLVGASMGGAIAIRFAADFPERTRALVLLGSVGPLVDKSELVHALDRGENPLIPASHEEFLAMLDFVSAKRPFLPRAIGEYIASEQVARRADLSELFAGWLDQDAQDLDAALARVKAPTLVVQGELDRVIHPSTARAIAEHIEKSKLMLLPDIGHVPQLEATKTVANAIAAFLD